MFYQARRGDSFCFILERTVFLNLFHNDFADRESERRFTLLTGSLVCSKSHGFFLRNIEIMSWKEP